MRGNQIQVKAIRPVVTAVVEEGQVFKFNIIDAYVEKQETDPLSWKLILVDEKQQHYAYDLHFS